MRAVVLLRLYPATWRRRYGQELEDLLGSRPLGISLAIDLLLGALDAHLHRALVRPAALPVGASPMDFSVIKRPTAFIPLAMSFLAVCLIIGHIAILGGARQPDEGTEAHLWQLLMAGQIPVIVLFAIVWWPRNRRQALVVLLFQFVAALTAAAPVFFLNW